MSSRVKPLLVAAALMTLASSSALAQTSTATAPASSSPASAEYIPTMTFDVASVREIKDVDMRGFAMYPGFFMPHSATFRARNSMVENVIWTAYGVMPYQVVGAPKWPWPTLFTIEAKGDSDADAKLAVLTKEQQKAEQEHMLQALLAERFKLKAHWETREGDTYNLVVAKGGPKMGAQGSIALSAEEKKNYGDHPAPPFSTRCDQQGCAFVGHGCPMDQLVQMLTAMFGRPVIDKTGLTDKYDFVLKYKGRWDSDRPADDPDPTLPLDQALQQELGLKVETAKGPLKVLVIDHIEKPSAN
jgi:uncharacterized protein (TIGR03435 family)